MVYEHDLQPVMYSVLMTHLNITPFRKQLKVKLSILPGLLKRHYGMQ